MPQFGQKEGISEINSILQKNQISLTSKDVNAKLKGNFIYINRPKIDFILIIVNQDPEQIARDIIDKHFIDCGWVFHDKYKKKLNAGIGVVVRYYLTQEYQNIKYENFATL